MFEIKRKKVPIIIIFFSIIIAIISFCLFPYTGGDNFAYFYLSRAIAQGKGYVELWSPQQSLHTQYPPIFPVLLLPATIFNSYILAKMVVFFCYVFLLFFSYRLFQELNKSKSEKSSLISLLFIAFAPVLIEYSNWVLSEVPYILISVLCLYFWAKKKYNISLLFASLAFLTRTAGITLLISVVIIYLLEFMKDKKKLVFPLFSLLTAFSWFFYGFLNKSPVKKSYFQSLLMKDPYSAVAENITILDLLLRIVRNILKMIAKVFSQIFWGQDLNPLATQSPEARIFAMYLGIIIFILVLFGIFGDKIFTGKLNKKEKEKHSENSTLSLMNLYSVLYLLTTWTWPSIWAADRRFYLPILPVIVFWMGRGVMNCVRLLPKNHRKGFSPFIIPGILVVHCIFIFSTGAPTKWKNNMRWKNNSIYPYKINYVTPYTHFKIWADNNEIPDNAVFIAWKTLMFYYYTNFRVVGYSEILDANTLKNTIEKNKVDYIIVFNNYYYKEIFYGGMKELVDEYDFVPVYADRGKNICVVRCNKKDIISDNEQSEGYLNKFLRKIETEQLGDVFFNKSN
jgi:hypothetical protein